MSGPEKAKVEVEKLSDKAEQAAMHLRELSKMLPANWISIMTVAQKAHDAFAELELKRYDQRALEKRLGDPSVSFAMCDRNEQPDCLISIDAQKCVDCGRCLKICGLTS